MARPARPIVQAVRPGSPAALVGIRPGDWLTHIGGEPVRDVLDYRFLSAESELTLTVRRENGETWTVRVSKDPDEDLGVDFGGRPTFDGIYTCRNRCLFCFVHQQPRGLRPSLNLMDDDFRLSFLHGNFVTLTDMPADQWNRILHQRLSPLYISVHSTDDELRAFLMGTPKARGIMTKLRDLADHGIAFHTQLVLCPGVNDGAHLDRSITDLVSLGPGALLSISVVPVGLTRYRDRLYPLRTYTSEEARSLLHQVEAWHRRLQPDWGFPVVYPSDEWYILAGAEIPPASFYGAYDQLENGVGMVRLFLEELRSVAGRLPERLSAPRRVTVVTGVLAGRYLEEAAARLQRVGGLEVRVLVVQNEFYGPTVTCAGLLTGRDMTMALADAAGHDGGLGDLVVLPAVAFRNGDGRTIDDHTLDTIRERIGGTPVVMAGSPAELAHHATGGALRPRRLRPTRLRFTRGAAEPGFYSVSGPRAAERTR